MGILEHVVFLRDCANDLDRAVDKLKFILGNNVMVVWELERISTAIRSNSACIQDVYTKENQEALEAARGRVGDVIKSLLKEEGKK